MENTNIILIGTGHILEKSVKKVEEVIEREKPDIVAVELCKNRYRALKGEVGEISVKNTLSSGNIFLIITQWLFAYVQRKIGEEFGVEPGAEMLAAMKKAEEFGCEVALIDRDISLTMQRFWWRMKFFEKIKMISSMIFALIHIMLNLNLRGEDKKKKKRKKKIMDIEVERITDEDVVSRLLNELREFSPGAATVLLDERDAYIARGLLEIRNKSKNSKIVGVVGAGHIQGIKKYLEHPEKIPPKEELCSLPKRRFSINIKKLLGIVFISTILLSILLFLLLGISYKVLLYALFYWIIINGVLSTGGVAIARGHPISAIVAFFVAWLTSINPFIAAGWFAGLTEAYFRKPTAEDARRLLKVNSFRELMRNRLFKVIFVAALANVGSIIGTIVGAYVVLHVVGINLQSVWEGLKAIFSL